MRRSCTMGLWPDGSVPVKRLVTWTLTRPTPMTISSASVKENVAGAETQFQYPSHTIVP